MPVAHCMKPVLVLQNLSADGPAYLGQWLAEHGVPFELVDSEAGQRAPAHLRDHSALAILGGEMSANDPLPALRDAELLVRQAVQAGLPTLGHCLGGQLMARAMGARIGPSPAPEIGWQELDVLNTPESAAWFGQPGPRTVFQWHFEAFELPPGAVRLAGNASCPNQAFALGPHLALQFHAEIDDEKARRWSHDESELWAAARSRHPCTAQTGPQMREGMALHLRAHQALAGRIYRRWLALAQSR